MTARPTVIEVEVSREDGSTETVPIDLDLNSLSLQESVALEESLGAEQFDQLMQTGEFPIRPSIIRSILFSRLKGKFPDLKMEDFDLDLGSLDVEGIDPEGQNGGRHVRGEGGSGNP